MVGRHDAGQPALRVDAFVAVLRLVGEQVLQLHRATLCRQDHAALDQVFQLAHVARPVVVHQRLQGALADAAQALVVQRGEARKQVARERLDVGAALAQRRDANRVDVEPVQQVAAEAPLRHRLVEVDVGRRHHAHVHLARALRAQTLDLAVLQHTQQLGLCRQRQVAHLVEEQRAAIGALEAPGARRVRPGVGALLHAEQLGLDQLGRQRRAVDRNKRAARAVGVLVQGARETLLAHAGLAGEQHRDLGARGALHQVVRVLERGRVADQHAARGGGLQRGLERLDLLAQRVHLVQQRVFFEVRAVGVAVGPFVDGFADDVAVVVPAGAALDFFEQDQLAHEGAGVAAGVAQQDPAGRLVHHAVGEAVGVRLPGVVPAELALELSGGRVHLEVQRRHARRALQHVQLRPDQEHLLQAAVAARLAGEAGVVRAAGVTHAGQQAAGVLGADRGDQVAPQGTERRRVQQHHAPLAEPDGAALGLEAQQPAQVGGGRVMQVRFHGVSW